MLIIKKIDIGSPSQKAGFLSGDQITDINGNKIKDALDFQFFSAEYKLNIKILRDKKEILIKLKREYDDTLGIEFNEMAMYECGTDCIFCFVTQNPQGLRKTLYFKDGDYRMSFLYGNYITLTNTGPNALKRIVHLRLSPLYISVHSTVPEIRKYYMNLRKDDDIMHKMKYLVDNGISLHTQIVLSPEINDGNSLLKTIDDLYSLSYGIESLAIVPVGLTKHRKNLPKIKPVTKSYAKKLIEMIHPIQSKIKASLNNTWVYLSDEFYILAGMDFPDEKYYDDYPQIENGVGMCQLFLSNFLAASKKFPAKLKNKTEITFATGNLAYNFLQKNILPVLHKIENLKVNLIPVKNLLYGSGVTVSGLLSMNCLYQGLRNKNLGSLLVLPSNIINHEGVFLDDGTPEILSNELKTDVYIFRDNWKELFKKIEKT